MMLPMLNRNKRGDVSTWANYDLRVDGCLKGFEQISLSYGY